MQLVLRIIIDVLLIAAVILLMIVVITPLLAEMQFETAQKAAKDYLWNSAELRFNEAIKIDPFNSEYPYRYAQFLKRKSIYQDNPIETLLAAEDFYKYALELNPRRAEYAIGLGQVQTTLFLTDQVKFNAKLREALNNFKKAIKNDPNGFNVSYSASYAEISLWEFLNDEERSRVLDRLKYILNQKPWYSEYIYKKLYSATKDSKLLEKIVPKSVLKTGIDLINIKKIDLDNAGPIILKSQWQGTVSVGSKPFIGGDMYWTGNIYAPILIPKGIATIILQAKGDKADNIPPHMIVELEGQEIGSIFVDSTEWKEYSFSINTDGGIKVLSVTFTNDGANQKLKEDRNLYVGEARVTQ